jgi:hypothetical protein
MKITTAFGEGTTRREMEEALEGIQAVADEDVFLVVEREDGEFLQMRRLPLERGRDGRLYRAKVPESLRRTFRAFADGTPGWDEGIEWIDVTDEKSLPGFPGRAPAAVWWAAGVLLIAALGYAASKILPHLTR